tara:strand:- start:81384 stop:81623 length:240 start_codon:yes stop_codon:yes gene_type:complete
VQRDVAHQHAIVFDGEREKVIRLLQNDVAGAVFEVLKGLFSSSLWPRREGVNLGVRLNLKPALTVFDNVRAQNKSLCVD